MLTKKQVELISKRMMETLKELEEELGGEFITEGGSYTENSYTPKLTFVKGSVQDKEKQDFAILAPRFGLKADDYGKTVTVDGDQFVIKAIYPTRRKYPIGVDDKNGNRMLFTISAIMNALK